MGLRQRILKVLRPECGGPRKRVVLEGLAKHYGYKFDFNELLRKMRDSGEIVMIGSKRGARYGLPKKKTRKRRFWTEDELTKLRDLYPRLPTVRVAKLMRRSKAAIYGIARELGLHKTAEYLASPAACRLRRGDNVGAAYRFPKGHVPANKGLRRPGWAPGRMRETQFRKGLPNGRAAALYMPLGAERIVDGYRYVKVAEVPNVAYTVNWLPLHILNWERANGRALPAGHCLWFRDGDRLNVELSNLELIERAENMRRNTLHRYPEPVVRAIQMRAALNRKINRMERDRGTHT